VETAQSTGWICPGCGRRVPSKIAACRCGVARKDAPHPVTPAAPAAAPAPALSGVGATVRIALALVVCGGLGAAWWMRTKDSAEERAADRMKTAAAISRRLTPAGPGKDQRPTDARDQVVAPPAALRLATPTALPGTAPATASAPASAAEAPEPLEDLVARVAPAVVTIETSTGRGSGFFVQPDTIVTNAHVARSEVSVRIRRASGDVKTARVERVAADIDVAILKLDAPLADQVVLPLGVTSRIRSGQEVVAIGSPLGVLSNSVTRGIVSAVRKTGDLTLIQTDAAINPGNSGGPMIDRSGVVIGINTASNSNTPGISWAVAVDHARELLAGPHLATRSNTAVAALNEAVSGVSQTERNRGLAAGRLDRALATMARRADELDDYWRRFKRSCYEGNVTGNFGHEWFALFDPSAMKGAVSPGCSATFSDVRTEANTIKNTVQALDEAARHDDVYPGTRRELRQKYHLDYVGWDR
jgi:S1-C subfamily serine protease